MRNVVLFMLLFLVATIDGQPFKEERHGTEELRSMLRQSMNQNRKLQQQMDRLKLVWSGLSQMCQALGQHDCACGDNSENSPVSKEAELGKGSTLRILSVKSSGNQSNTVNLTVTYTAQENHQTDWIGTYYKFDISGQYRIVGEKVSHGSGKFSSSAAFTDPNFMRGAYMNVYSGSETAQVSFESIAITKAAEQILPEYNMDMLSLNYTQTAPLNGDMNISIEIRGTLHESSGIERAELYFTAVNTSSNPPTLFEANLFTSDTIGVSAHPRTSNTSTLVVTLHESLLNAGGILTIRAPPTQVYKERLRDDLMTKLLQGYSINVLSAESGLVVPNNTVGLYKTGNVTVVTSLTSLMCAAMGNPSPDVHVYKVLKDGRRKKMKTDSIKFDEYAQIATYTLRADDKKTPGLYVCSAKSGTAIVEDFRGVQVYKPVKFDESKTGVVKNNTRKVVFGCKVTWTMEPDLEFRLYRYDGPVIGDNDKYEVSTQRTGKRSSRITLSVSPPDEAIHTVVCVVRSAGVVEYSKIELFPGEDRDENWDFMSSFDGDYVGNHTIPFY